MKQFELNLTNQGKEVGLAVGFTILMTAVLVGGLVALQGYSATVTYLILFSMAAGSLYGFVFLLRKVVIEPSLVTIVDDRITVLNRNTDEGKQLPFDEIISYQYLEDRGRKELRLNQKDSISLKLIDKSEDFSALVSAFELALVLHQRGAHAAPISSDSSERQVLAGLPASGNISVRLRGKTFFEKPISTVIMVVMSITVILLTCFVFMDSKPIKGSLFLGYSGYVSYATAWYSARKQRQ